MNEAEKANQESEVFLKEVRLQNYKSIIDTTIDFKPGLNIIIGNNGSGKTNFLNFLNRVISFDFDDFSFGKAEILFEDKKEHKFIIEENKSGILEIQDFKKRNKPNIKLIVSGQKEKEFTNVDDSVLDIERWSMNYMPYFLKYGIPHQQQIVDIPTSITFTFNDYKPQVSDFTDKSLFSISIFFKIIFSLSKKDSYDINDIKNCIKQTDKFIESTTADLITNTDIKKVRISPNFNIYLSNENKKVDIKNLYIEFFVNDEWVPYDNLSDGTKRLFYIISEITSYNLSEIMRLNSPKDNFISNRKKRMILLEEPELGIHPHQLHKLMLFIKEQSREKQIILTTHSPQVLNILNSDELDRIIICSYDQQKGTQLRHLTGKETQKARLYMQDDFLSDYWIHSDLEPIS